MNTFLPALVCNGPEVIVAWRGGRPINAGQFVADARSVAEQLPDADYMLNRCEDRYRFAVGLVAAMLRGQASVLPHNLLPATLTNLQKRFVGLYALRDNDESLGDLVCFDCPPPAQRPAEFDVPAFAADAVAAYLFTSGSTGAPETHARSWGTIVHSARAEAVALGLTHSEPWQIVATVPSQHSYGFESAIFLALQSGAAIDTSRPFFPTDVRARLREMPGPAILVTTPVHLRALCDGQSNEAIDSLKLVLSATAPLSNELAKQAEKELAAPVHEIYGATESGQTASRRTLDGPRWTPLPGVRVFVQDEQAYAQGGHVGERVALSDTLLDFDDGRFELMGRSSDMINIAGKRSSLVYLENVLKSIAGVQDGALLLLQTEGAPARITGFAIAPHLTSKEVIQALRGKIEAAFVPRPLYIIDRLPRDGTGKITRHVLETLAITLKQQ